MDHHNQDRRTTITLSEEQLQQIADMAVDTALKRIQIDVGRKVLSRIMITLGYGMIALAVWWYGRHG